MPRFTLSRGQRKVLLAIGLPLGAFLAVRYLLPLVLPTLLALLLARPLMGLTDRLRKRLPGSLAAGLTLGGALLLLGGGLALLLWRLSQEASLMLRRLPELLEALPGALSRLGALLKQWAAYVPEQFRAYLTDLTEQMLSRGLSIPTKLYDFFSSFLSETLLGLPAAALFLTVVLLSAFFLCRDHARLSRSLRLQIPPRWLAGLSWLKARCEETLLRWVRVQGMLVLATFCILLAGFLLMGLPTAFFLALCISLLDALPIIGAGTALIPWAVLCLLTGRVPTALALLVLWGLCWLCRTLLEPRLLSARLGLHPLWTLLAVYIGFHLSGVWGMLLYPLFAILLRQVWLWGLPDDLPRAGAEKGGKGL